MIIKATKKPVQITAIKFTGKNTIAILEWMDAFEAPSSGSDKEIVIHTLEGDMTASIGNYIIKGVQDEFYPCKPDIFNATYDIEK